VSIAGDVHAVLVSIGSFTNVGICRLTQLHYVRMHCFYMLHNHPSDISTTGFLH
jgi:hypothetical protein